MIVFISLFPPNLMARIRLLNRVFETHQPLDLGLGTLIALQKPNKKKGPPGNLRPIVLLTALRKAVSLLTLKRISHRVNTFLSDNQSGFRAGRSTADAVWCHKWLAATVQKYKYVIEILGIDMSKAFDTIQRHRLLAVLETFLLPDDLRLVRLLIANTTLSVRLGGFESSPFHTTIGTPQGDSLSPVLFVVYLDAALRDVLATAPHRCPADSTLPIDIIYADDTDFVSTSSAWLAQLEPLAATVLRQWNLHVNAEKTEHTKLTRQQDRVSEEWRMTKKLGSLIGDDEDITRRKQLATASYRAMYSLWKRRTLVREELRLRLYNAFVMPVLLYNSGTWAPTSVAEAQLDSFHRRQLRSLIGISWPQTISNAALYKRCKAQPISNFVRLARWRLFGHILRMPDGCPAVAAMINYYQVKETVWRGRPRTTLPIVLSRDLQRVGRRGLKTLSDLLSLREIAQGRGEWKDLCKDVCKSNSGVYD